LTQAIGAAPSAAVPSAEQMSQRAAEPVSALRCPAVCSAVASTVRASSGMVAPPPYRDHKGQFMRRGDQICCIEDSDYTIFVLPPAARNCRMLTRCRPRWGSTWRRCRLPCLGAHAAHRRQEATSVARGQCQWTTSACLSPRMPQAAVSRKQALMRSPIRESEPPSGRCARRTRIAQWRPSRPRCLPAAGPALRMAAPLCAPRLRSPLLCAEAFHVPRSAPNSAVPASRR
jgi:hypothetical protein